MRVQRHNLSGSTLYSTHLPRQFRVNQKTGIRLGSATDHKQKKTPLIIMGLLHKHSPSFSTIDLISLFEG